RRDPAAPARSGRAGASVDDRDRDARHRLAGIRFRDRRPSPACLRHDRDGRLARPDPRPLRVAPAGGLCRMTGATLLWLALTYAQTALAIAGCLATIRILKGPRAQDRVLALDCLYITTMLLFFVTGMRLGTPFF